MVVPEVLWLSLLNATLWAGLPVLMVMMAIERIGASLAAQTGMVGPMSTILMGTLLLDEPFTGWVAFGTLFVVAGIYLFHHCGQNTLRAQDAISGRVCLISIKVPELQQVLHEIFWWFCRGDVCGFGW